VLAGQLRSRTSCGRCRVQFGSCRRRSAIKGEWVAIGQVSDGSGWAAGDVGAPGIQHSPRPVAQGGRGGYLSFRSLGEAFRGDTQAARCPPGDVSARPRAGVLWLVPPVLRFREPRRLRFLEHSRAGVSSGRTESVLAGPQLRRVRARSSLASPAPGPQVRGRARNGPRSGKPKSSPA